MNGLPFFQNRPQIARALYLISLLAALLFAALWIVRFSSIVTDENWYTDVDGKVTIIDVVPGGVSDRAGLRVGDVITSINGTPVRDKFDANNHLLRSRGGEPLVYGIVRDGAPKQITIYTAEYGLPLIYLSHILIGISFLSLGTWVFLRRYRQPVARLFGWAHLAFGFTLLISQNYSYWHYPDIWTMAGYQLSPLSWVLSIGSILHLLLYFPAQRFVKPLRRREIAWLYVVPLAAIILSTLLVDMLQLKGFVRGLVDFALMAAAITALQVLLYRRYRLFESVEYRQRMKQLRPALLIGIAFVAGSLIVSDYTSWQVVFFVGLAVPALVFRTIVRYRLFDLYVVVRRGSMYTMLTIATGTAAIMLFFVLLYMLPVQTLDMPVLHVTSDKVEIIRIANIPEEQQLVTTKRLFLMMGASLLALLWWVHRRTRRYLDTRFYRGSYDYKRALTSFSNLSHSYSDTSTLAQAVVNDLVKLMYLKGAVFALRNGEGYLPLASNGIFVDTALLRFEKESIVLFEEAFSRSPSQPVDNLSLRERFAGTDVEFITAVSTADQRIEALILLGEKEAETNYSREDVELLDNLATNVADALTTMRFYEGAREKERMRKELEVARRIQLSSLPDALPELPGIDMAAESLPAHEVGGDFYDFLPRHDSTMLLIGDVSGKGTSAALYLARIQGIMRTIESYHPSPWELFVRLNTQIFDHIEKSSFLTLAALRLDLLRSEVTYLRAGHLPLLHYNSLSREVNLHQPPGIGIGLDRHAFAEQLAETSIFVRGGDILVLLTDGITEAENESGQQLGMDGIVACLQDAADASADGIKRALLECVSHWAGARERTDDQTLVVVKFTPVHTQET